ncbi:thiazole-phosphate synthase [Neorhodopirellula lusitana]|uniref:Thiazole synthase n=1 Tax=Neorhodopirellula lusitana TaxID=445327 RepID=A0ABY1Q8Z7_9BACT|nr:thiazole synthase [Neorhodopirellula lusitana]SMP61846.1 thiazole-phosphate synthase [Neorhodopirellula lusitana]
MTSQAESPESPSTPPVGDTGSSPSDRPFQIGKHQLDSRLIVGTGRYDTMEQMRDSLIASGSDCVTVAVRRERLYDRNGQNILDFIDSERYTLLPNTAGCYTATDAVRAAKLGREILRTLGNPGADWVKLEVLGDSKTLLPDPVETVKACEQLVEAGFSVLCYTSDCPVTALRLKKVGAASVMPAGSPIGSGQGILNPGNLQIILEYLKDDDANYPIIIDAGVGTASDVAIAMELGADGVLMNTAIAHARDPVRMATAMKHAVIAGYEAARAGRIPKRLYGTASSPSEGVISTRPYGSTAGQ